MTPQPWATEAARLPLAFAQVREDPRLDAEWAAPVADGAEGVVIASGGDTAAVLGRLPFRRLHLADMNAAQIALSRLKWHLAEHSTADAAARLLGHAPMPTAERLAAVERLAPSLSFAPDAFGPPEFVAEVGVDHAGRYEVCFAQLRAALARGLTLEAALADAMSLPNLVALFGAQATQNPARPFHEHFAARIRLAEARPDARENPFLSQMLGGSFPVRCRYDWLRLEARFGLRMAAEPVWLTGRMADVLRDLPPGRAAFVHLSNILDWLPPHEAEATLAAATRALRPGGRLIVRQLNSTLDIPALAADIAWDGARGRAFAAADRSFFYPHIHVGVRR